MMSLLFVAFALVASIQMKNTDERLACFRPRFSTMVVCAFLLVWSLLSFSGVSSFLYVMF